MEQKMLQHFRFRISMPTLHAFLTRFLKLGAGGHLCSPRAFYFAERALQVRRPGREGGREGGKAGESRLAMLAQDATPRWPFSFISPIFAAFSL
jgi:hypothetical protein